MRRRPPDGSSTLLGIALTMIGAAGFASKGVIAKFLYADGWADEAVLATRSFIALPIIAVWALWAVGPRALLRPPPRALLGAAGAGCLCYFLGAVSIFGR